MTTNVSKPGVLASVAKTVSNFFSSLFLSSSTREFNRLKNFIAS